MGLKIIKKAFKEIQKLAHNDFTIVEQIIRGLSRGNYGDCRTLKGAGDLKRTRKGDVRVIWKKEGSDNQVVIKAGRRDKVYKALNEDRYEEQVFNLVDLVGVDHEEIDSLPTYEWAENHVETWYQFIYGSYIYSPVLTTEQQAIFQNLWAALAVEQPPEYCRIRTFLVQSPPGTGKTVTAALLGSKLSEEMGWNVIFILPPSLCEEVRQYTAIQRVNEQVDDRVFFVGTLQEWIRNVAQKINPTLKIATFEEELRALRAQAQQNHIGDLSEKDLMLYTAFVYHRDSQELNVKNPIYLNNRERINILRGIDESRYEARLINGTTWLDGLRKVTEGLAPELVIPRGSPTIFIFDEAQDYLLKELEYVKEMLIKWQSHGYNLAMWLLGDTNQRIKPVDFDWTELCSGVVNLRYNYRNTQKILEFANILHGFARRTNPKNARHLPKPCDPRDAFEVGEKVTVLEVTDKSQAEDFLKNLSDNIIVSDKESKRYLLKRLIQQVCVIYKERESLSESITKLQGTEYLRYDEAKGREFDACVALFILEGRGNPSFEEASIWYTIVTRARYRLLIIAKSEELDRIGRDVFSSCDLRHVSESSNLLISWISELSGSEESCKNLDIVRNLIFEGIKSEPPHIYWDMYTSISFTQAKHEQINAIEDVLLEKLKDCDKEYLEKELALIVPENISSESDRVALKCLLLRSLDRSWDALVEAKHLNVEEYHRIVLAIAAHLDQKGLPYEARRVKMKAGIEFPKEYPFSELITDNDRPLVTVICEMASAKILGGVYV